MDWEKSVTPNQWLATTIEDTGFKTHMRLRRKNGNWSCRKRKQMGTPSPWTDITADSLEEAQTVAETLYRMGAL